MGLNEQLSDISRAGCGADPPGKRTECAFHESGGFSNPRSCNLRGKACARNNVERVIVEATVCDEQVIGVRDCCGCKMPVEMAEMAR